MPRDTYQAMSRTQQTELPEELSDRLGIELAILEKDHASMQEMFFTPPPPMSEILRILGDLETKIRNLPA